MLTDFDFVFKLYRFKSTDKHAGVILWVFSVAMTARDYIWGRKLVCVDNGNNKHNNATEYIKNSEFHFERKNSIIR